MKKGALLLLLVALAPCAFAQSRPPPTANPLQTLPQVQSPKPGPKVQLTVKSRRRNARLRALLATPIKLTHVNISGVHAIPFAKVSALFKPLVGKQIHVRDLATAATACAKLYKQAGYALSFCYLPAQNFKNGLADVVAVEGHIVAVDFKGGSPGTLERKIREITRPLLDQRPLRTATFERCIQLLGMLPGVRIAAQVPAPTTTDGATRLLLTVTRRHFNSSYGVDFNHPGIGGILGVSTYALTPLAEQLDARVMVPHGHQPQSYYSLGYSQMLGGRGLMLRLSGSHYHGNPDAFDVLPAYLRHRLTENRVAASLSYPLILDRRHSLLLSGGLYGSNEDDRYQNQASGAALRIRTRVRAAHLDLAYTRVRKRHATKLSFGVTHGLGIWGAGQDLVTNLPGPAYLAEADMRFTRYNASLSHTDSWPSHFSTALQVAIQYSPDRLPSGEQISFGGPAFAMAYDPGSTSGDSGWGVSAEIGRSFSPGKHWLKTLTPYVKLQAARAYLNGGSLAVNSLDSCAIGLRLSDGHHYSVDISAAQPLGDLPPNENHRHPRLDLTFAYKLD